MVTDGQFRRLLHDLEAGTPLATAARRAGMTEKTARHYRDYPTAPSRRKVRGTFRTRVDPFAAVFESVELVGETAISGDVDDEKNTAPITIEMHHLAVGAFDFEIEIVIADHGVESPHIALCGLSTASPSPGVGICLCRQLFRSQWIRPG